MSRLAFAWTTARSYLLTYDPDPTIVLPTTVTSNPASIVNINEPANVAILKSNEPTKVMTAEPYPPVTMSHLVRRVSNEEASNIRRDWTGNDESARNHHGKVPLSQSPLRLRLSWKKGAKDSADVVGIFDLDLKQLLKAGYIRYELKSEDEVRLRFYHDWDNVVKIQVNSKGPGLPIGRVP